MLKIIYPSVIIAIIPAVNNIPLAGESDAVLDSLTRVKAKLNELKSGLPEGVRIVPVYDRSGLIDRAAGNLNHTLLKEILVVLLITFFFLFHVRSTLIAAFTLPTGVLTSVLPRVRS